MVNSINPSIVDSLGNTVNFNTAVNLFDPQLVVGGSSSTFTNFMNALASQLPTSVSLRGTFNTFANQYNPPQSTPAGSNPSITYTQGGSSGIFSGNINLTTPGVVTQTVTLNSSTNFDPNTILSGFLAQFSSNRPFSFDPSNMYPPEEYSYLGTFQAQFKAYIDSYYGNYASSQLSALTGQKTTLSALVDSNLDGTPRTGIDWTGVANNTFQGSSILAGLQADFNSSLGLYGADSSITGIWATPSSNSNAQASNWLNNFFANFRYPPNGASVTLSYFLGQMQQQSVQSVVTATLSALGPNQTIPSGMQQYLLQYQGVYNALFPNSDSAAQKAAFTATLTKFYQAEVRKYGPYVTPSQAFGDFVASMKSQYVSNLPTDFTSLASQNAKKTLIISDIYKLIASMVNSIQEIAAAQSTRLVLLTNWQQAYSRELSMIPTFLAATYSFLDPSVRTDLNGTFNQSKLTNMQTLQSLVGDDAKALQSNINQSNDAVSQQANMAQSLLQELNTILAAIFK